MLTKTKIDWCDFTWNPVYGCLRGCEYCYAQKFVKRFAYKIAIKEWELQGTNNENRLASIYSDIKNFQPTWLESNFQKEFPKKPSRIFVDSMSDIEFWKPEWMELILEKIRKYPQHTFLFLTKSFDIYYDYIFPENCWLGYTIINQAQMDKFGQYGYTPERNLMFYSFEPLQSKLIMHGDPNWIIIGMETGNRKNKIIPDYEWVSSLISQCRLKNIPVFMKENLLFIWHKNYLIQEFPE